MLMPWPRAVRFLRAVHRDRACSFIEQAVAARAAWVDGKDWEKWLETFQTAKG